MWNRSFEQTLTQGVWKVNGGVLEAAAGDGDSRFRFGAETWGDHELSVDAMRPSGNGILTVACAAIGSHYALARRPAALCCHSGGCAASCSTAAGRNGRWYNVRVKIEGTRRQVWLDGKPLIDLADTEGPANGQAFVGVHDGAASFAHLRVKGSGGTPQFVGVPTAARDWYAIGAGEVALDANLPLNGGQSLRIVTHDADSGIEQPGFAVRAGDALRGSLWLSGTGPGLVVRLLDGDKVLAQQTIAAPTADWTEFPLLLTPTAASANATLRIEARAHSDVKLDQVSLMAGLVPRQRWLSPRPHSSRDRLAPARSPLAGWKLEERHRPAVQTYRRRRLLRHRRIPGLRTQSGRRTHDRRPGGPRGIPAGRRGSVCLLQRPARQRMGQDPRAERPPRAVPRQILGDRQPGVDFRPRRTAPRCSVS